MVSTVKSLDNRSPRTAGGAGLKYRFSLQWYADTVEKVQAGDFLESLGNRKSELVVMAVTEYLNANPEILAAGNKPKIIVKPSYTREQMESLVKALIEERLAGIRPVANERVEPAGEITDIEPDIDEMLKNLEIFS
jgi:hypothetical protein